MREPATGRAVGAWSNGRRGGFDTRRQIGSTQVTILEILRQFEPSARPRRLSNQARCFGRARMEPYRKGAAPELLKLPTNQWLAPHHAAPAWQAYSETIWPFEFERSAETPKYEVKLRSLPGLGIAHA